MKVMSEIHGIDELSNCKFSISFRIIGVNEREYPVLMVKLKTCKYKHGYFHEGVH